MKLIESKVEYLPQEPSLDGVYKQIELCGRTCYKSEDKITKSSAQKFVDRMYNSNHTAMLEHGTVYLKMVTEDSEPDAIKYERNPYSIVTYDGYNTCITTNLRVIAQMLWFADLPYICEPTEFHEKRYTFKFTCSRAIANELVRHRVFSFAQESQRYCGYDKSKFGSELTFIMPKWYKEGKYDSTKLNEFDKFLKQTEDLYMFYRNCEMQAQEARDILPNCTKTELCMTGFAKDWSHILDLRLFQKTGPVHPDMLDLMKKLEVVAKENNIWNELL